MDPDLVWVGITVIGGVVVTLYFNLRRSSYRVRFGGLIRGFFEGGSITEEGAMEHAKELIEILGGMDEDG